LAVPGSGGAATTGFVVPVLEPDVPLDGDGLADGRPDDDDAGRLPVDDLSDDDDAADWGDVSLGRATTVSVRVASLMAINRWRSCSSNATVWLLGIASMAAAAPDAPDADGPITHAATETAATAIAATTATERMTPVRRRKRPFRLEL
jgi:hypothetical protein